jgi:hypothetical protein
MDAVEQTTRSHAGPTGHAWGAAWVVVALVAGSAACEGKSRLPPVSEASVGGAGGGAVGGGDAGGEGAIGQGAMGAGASGATGAGAGQVGGAGWGAGAPCGEYQPVIGACETSFALDDEYTVVAVRAPDGDEPCFGQLAVHPELITVMLDLEGDVQSLTVGLGLPGVTTSTFTVGETLMVSDASAGSFTFVTLRRDVLETLVGVYTQQGFFGSTLAVAPSEELCFVDDDLGTGGICHRSANAVTATFEGQTSAPVGPGKSAEVGGYTFTSDHYWMEEGLNCNGGLEFLFGYVLSP